jgi:hypothetical protein
MTRRNWQGLTMVLALATLAGGACSKGGNQAGTPADSAARNLSLVPSESTPALADTAPAAAAATPTPSAQPAPAPAPARAPTKSRSAPAPRHPAAPAAAASYTAGTGTHVALANGSEISSRSAKAGQDFTATVRSDVKDAAGHVVIPAGSTVHGTIVEVKAGGANSAGTLTLAVNSVTVRGNSYPIEATIESAQTVREGRGVTGKEAAKVGVGAAAGAIAGRILGKDTKGTIIGGVVGAAAGAGVAAATRSVDIVLPAGGEVEISLSKPVTIPAH